MSPSAEDDAIPPGAPEFSDELFRAWATTTLIGVFIVQDGVFAWVNDHMQRALGYAAADLIGRRPGEVVHPDDRAHIRAQARLMLRGELRTAYEYRYVTRCGEVRWALETVASAPLRGRRAVLGNFMDITARKQTEASLTFRAFHDPLTGLANRAQFLDRLTHALARRDRRRGAAAVLYLDLDGFKAVNDRFGHHAGDTLLIEAGRRLTGNVRPGDTVARLGGDEFTLLLEEMPNAASALRVAAQLVAALGRPFSIGGEQVSVSASIGVAYSAELAVKRHGQLPEELLRAADAALYRAKARGGATAMLAERTPAFPIDLMAPTHETVAGYAAS